jgi:4-aminobutyrate aminotransferase-like enzyme
MAAETAAALDEALATLHGPAVAAVRGLGLMRGVELRRPDGGPDAALAGAVVGRALKEGLVLLAGSPEGNVLSLTPPFVIERDEIAFAVGRIQEYVTSRPGSIS